jgi:hypothetical protein
LSLQFSRSIRSLTIDSYRASRIGMILAAILLLVLILWFLLAKVSLYETSTNVTLTQDGRLLASFSPEAQARIQPGQTATIRLTGGAEGQTVLLRATVIGKDPATNQVEFWAVANNAPPDILQGNPTARVDVQVESITPARLVLRASGKYLGQTQKPISTQPAFDTGQ